MSKVLSSNKGSLSAEASIAMAVFLITVVSLIACLGGLYTSSLMDECLLDASFSMRSEMALMQGVTEFDQAAEIIFQQRLKSHIIKAIENRSHQRLIYDTKRLIKTIDVSRSQLNYKDGRMCLSIAVQWPLTYLSRAPIVIERQLICRKWTPFVDVGAFLKAQGITEVYMANHPSVYHTNSGCRSLKNRDKRRVSLEEIQDDFRECKFCVKERKQ